MPETEEQLARAALAHLSASAPAPWEITLALGEYLRLAVTGTDFRYSLTFSRGAEDISTPDPWPRLASFAAIKEVLAVALADWRAYKLAKHLV